MKQPDVFIVGAPKSGTTALYTYLKTHPEIFMCSPKEPQFFAEDIRGGLRCVRTREEYLGLFQAGEGSKRAGEASTLYLRSPSAAGQIKAFNAASKIIVMLRNPVDVICRLYVERIISGTEVLPNLEAALERDSGAGNLFPEKPPALPYRAAVRFSGQLLRYFEKFGRENVHVIVYEDFKSRTSTVYRETLEFLGVQPDFKCRFVPVNQDRRLLRQPPAPIRSISHAILPLWVRRFVGDRIRGLNQRIEPPAPMRDELRKRLQREFEPELEQLSRLLNRDLTDWCR